MVLQRTVLNCPYSNSIAVVIKVRIFIVNVEIKKFELKTRVLHATAFSLDRIDCTSIALYQEQDVSGK